MLESGDYIDIRFQDEVRYKKPVGIYWLQAAVVKTASALGFETPLPRFGSIACLRFWARSPRCSSPIGRHLPSFHNGPHCSPA